MLRANNVRPYGIIMCRWYTYGKSFQPPSAKKKTACSRRRLSPHLLLKLLAHFHILDDLLNRAVKAEHAAVERQIIIPRVIPVVAGVVLVVAGAVLNLSE